MSAASVLLCAIVGALISSKPVLSQAFLQVPESLNVTVGAVAKFFCRADGAAVSWTVNDIPVNQLDDPNITPDDGPVVDGLRTRILRITADVQHNNSVIHCLSFTFGAGETASDPAVLMVQGLLSAPTNVQASQPNSSAIQLNWDPPFTLDITNVDPDIIGYTVSITNNDTKVTSERNVTEPELLLQMEFVHRGHQVYFFVFSVSALNSVGVGEKSDVIDVVFGGGLRSASRPDSSAIHPHWVETPRGEILLLEDHSVDYSSRVVRVCAWNPVGVEPIAWNPGSGSQAREPSDVTDESFGGGVVMEFNSVVQDVTNSVPCIDDKHPDVNAQCDMKPRPYMYIHTLTVVLRDSSGDLQQLAIFGSSLTLILYVVYAILRMLARVVFRTEQQKRWGGNEAVWQQARDSSSPLDELQLQKISELITDWKPLARYLGLKNPTIAGIEEDNRNSKERKYQTLYTWSQREGDDATLKALLQCVEFDLGERDLAQRIVDTL